MTDSLLTLAERYSAATGMSQARLATLVRNDGKFFDRLRAGGGVLTHTYEASVRWFGERWPEGADWPAEIERPEPVSRNVAG